MADIVIRLVQDEEREAAFFLEEQIFRREKYPYDYRAYDDQSRMFGAFDGDRCIGALRIVAQAPLLPPALAHCTVWDPEAYIAMGDQFAEMATHAVLEEYRHRGVGLDLIRASYVDGHLRGLKAMAVITEPETAQWLNDNVHFACRQIGDVGFKGHPCAPFIHVFAEVERKLAEEDPNLYRWFTEGIPEELLAAPLPSDVV